MAHFKKPTKKVWMENFFMREPCWCPPLPLLRKLGVRTAYEICTEKMIMKYLRGDFENLPHNAAELIEAAQSETVEEK